eukprot:TRINITY_DN4492_c1_g1_i3.p1 TRINITY_DN4492_c1_g1~~TRINITY_DN4492_c1_g1_i3.p1  ORF type:complete len:103 (+),score=20.61 TRINITY_DN4492_c1_g1_i3:320-628(+)
MDKTQIILRRSDEFAAKLDIFFHSVENTLIDPHPLDDAKEEYAQILSYMDEIDRRIQEAGIGNAKLDIFEQMEMDKQSTDPADRHNISKNAHLCARRIDRIL